MKTRNEIEALGFYGLPADLALPHSDLFWIEQCYERYVPLPAMLMQLSSAGREAVRYLGLSASEE